MKSGKYVILAVHFSLRDIISSFYNYSLVRAFSVNLIALFAFQSLQKVSQFDGNISMFSGCHLRTKKRGVVAVRLSPVLDGFDELY